MEFALQKTLYAPEVKNIRKNLNMKQKELAVLLNVSVKTVEHWESSGGSVSGAAAALLCILRERPWLPEELENAPTIKLIIQPVVENSIYHGIKYLQEEGLITIEAKAQDDDKIRIIIRDNGIGMSPETLSSLLDKQSEHKHSKDGNGIGLANIDERIKLSYGEEYGLSIESELDEGTTVTITIPHLPPIEPVVIKHS